MDVAAGLDLLDRNACGCKRFRVGDTLVTQRIELAGDDERLRQIRQLAAQRRDARIGAVGGRTIDVPEPVHQRARQEIAGRIVGIGRAIERTVGDRAYQELPCDVRAAALLRQLAGHGRDIAAGAPAGDHDRTWFSAELGGVLGNPARRGVAIFCCRRESMFGRMPVSDTDEDHPGAPAHVTAERIVGLLVAEHPAAAVEIDHDRMRPRRCRSIKTIRQRTIGALQHAIADLADRPSRGTGLVELVHEVARPLSAERLDRRQVHLRQHTQYQPHVRLQANDLAVVALRGPTGTGELEAEHAAAGNLVADAAVGTDATGIGHHAPRLAGNIGARVPGVRQPVQRQRCAIGHVLRPAVLRRFGGFDRREAGVAHRNQPFDDPIRVLFDRHRHVRQHGRAAGPGDHEQVREISHGQSKICLRPVGPDVGQRFAVATGDRMHGHDGAGHGVEAGGEHDHVDVERALVGGDAGRRDLLDRLLPQVNQRDVRAVIGGIIVGIETWPLGAERMIEGTQRRSRLGILHDVADLLADQFADQRIAVDIDALVGPELGQDIDEIASGPRLLEALAALGIAQLPTHRRLLRPRHTCHRPAGLLAVRRAVAFQQRGAIRRRGAIVSGQGKVRRALKHRQMRRLLRDQRYRLDAR